MKENLLNQSTDDQGNKAKPKSWFLRHKIISGILIFIIIMIIIGSNSEESKKSFEQGRQEAYRELTSETIPSKEKTIPTIVPTSEKPSKNESKLNYQIKYTLTDKRYDGGKSFYVLVDSVDLSNNNFKDEMRSIIREIVKEKGNKISIDILDDKDVLDLFYKSHYGANQLGRILNQEELNKVGNHLIASYSGDLETGIYLNTLYFFSGTFTNNPTVGKYVETVEFDAKK